MSEFKFAQVSPKNILAMAHVFPKNAKHKEVLRCIRFRWWMEYQCRYRIDRFHTKSHAIMNLIELGHEIKKFQRGVTALF